MRKHLLVLLLLCNAHLFIGNQIHAQSTYFTYDASGNRNMRQVIYLQDSQSSTASDSNQSNTNARFAEVLEDIQINLYPNPTKGIVHITATNTPENSIIEFEIVDLSGNILLHSQTASKEFIADFSPYEPGTYFIRFTIGSSQSSWKVIRN